MPKMDSIEFLSIFRRTYSAEQLPVIMVTVETDSDTMLTSFNLGADDYITKPIDIHVLTARVKINSNNGKLFSHINKRRTSFTTSFLKPLSMN